MTNEELKTIYEYKEGFLFYKKPKQKTRENKPVGYIDDKGYMVTRLNGKNYKIHRLVWQYFNGYEAIEIDHINGIRSDNRIENLRSVKHIENMQNRIEHRKGNTVGVRKMGRKWQARIEINKIKIVLGVYETEKEAGEAYRKAYQELTTACV